MPLDRRSQGDDYRVMVCKYIARYFVPGVSSMATEARPAKVDSLAGELEYRACNPEVLGPIPRPLIEEVQDAET